MSEARLRWQCRRGMRELDELLLGYFERRYPVAGEPEKRAFRSLLALPDNALIAYLLHGEAVKDEAMADVVRRIRDRASA
jgi:antitoxin CptB